MCDENTAASDLSGTTVKVALCDPLFHMHSDCATDRTPQLCTALVVLVVALTRATGFVG